MKPPTKVGMAHFCLPHASNYGEVISALELAPSGQGYRVRERFAKFVNLPELMAMFNKIADIQTADMLDLPVPKVMGGKPQTVAVDPSPELKEYTAQLVERSKAIYEREVPPEKDNMLCVTNDGRNAALDMRCINPNAADYPDSKVNTCIQKVLDIYHDTTDRKLTQMIFSDLSTPKSKLTVPMKVDETGAFTVDRAALEAERRPFCIYEDIKIKLMENGVHESEIAFIHDASTDDQKEKMFAAVRRGEVRIILGSTAKMGAGTNAQTRLIALHHIDCPYRPAEIGQT
jgi:hypothetical protein